MNSADAYRRIWDVVKRIPCGCVATYGQVAAEAGLPRRARLAGYALHQAPEGLPWFRVVNASGRISLPPNSASHRRQRELLEREGVVFVGSRIDLKAHRWRPRSDAPVLD